ncbi:MAG: hypothetical protein EBT75_01255 [Proteobacteria bacterium]|nr:hypothetical protein [Pseudomonadota bacterium]NBS49311.1 hypothetical protein [Verrucomicrobiota bacterium]
MALLTQNSELKPHGIWNWTIPAWYTTLADGTRFKTCPQAGVCAQLCYARNGTYLFKNVRAAHDRNLQFVLDTPTEWRDAMLFELRKPKFNRIVGPRDLPYPIEYTMLDDWMQGWARSGLPAIRIHDAGDFFAEWYLDLWLEIAHANPHLLFYAYTKEVSLFNGYKGVFPPNFRYLFSTGGLEDHLIDGQRHAEVFPTLEALETAGYISQGANDLLAIMLPTNNIGITANNIAHFKKKMAGKTFGELTNEKRRGRRDQTQNGIVQEVSLGGAVAPPVRPRGDSSGDC